MVALLVTDHFGQLLLGVELCWVKLLDLSLGCVDVPEIPKTWAYHEHFPPGHLCSRFYDLVDTWPTAVMLILILDVPVILQDIDFIKSGVTKWRLCRARQDRGLRCPRLDEVLVQKVLLYLEVLIREITDILRHFSGVSCMLLLLKFYFCVWAWGQQPCNSGLKPVRVVLAQLYRIFLTL